MRTRRRSLRRAAATGDAGTPRSGQTDKEDDATEKSVATSGGQERTTTTRRRKNSESSDTSKSRKTRTRSRSKSSESKSKDNASEDAGAVADPERSSDLRTAAAQMAKAFMTFAKKKKSKDKKGQSKTPMTATLCSDLNVEPYINCGGSLLNPSLLLGKASRVTGQNGDVLPKKPVVLATPSENGDRVTEKGLDSYRRSVQSQKNARAKQWWHIEEQEMTEAMKRDVEILKRRQFLYTKNFYKVETRDRDRKDRRTRFHVGTIIAGAFEPKSATIKKHERGRNFVSEMLADRDFKSTIRRRFTGIQEKAEASGRGHRKKRKRR